MAEPDNVLAPIEDLLMNIPGCSTPIGRIAVFGGGGAAFAYAVRPSISFTDAGVARPWILMDARNPEATLMPAWMWGFLPAALFGIFI
jgi:hypothetical protein